MTKINILSVALISLMSLSALAEGEQASLSPSPAMEASMQIDNLDLQITLQKKQNELLTEKLNNRLISNRLSSQDKELALSNAKLDKSIKDTNTGSSGATSINPNSLPIIPIPQLTQVSPPLAVPVIEKPKEAKKMATDYGSIVVNDKTFKMVD